MERARDEIVPSHHVGLQSDHLGELLSIQASIHELQLRLEKLDSALAVQRMESAS